MRGVLSLPTGLKFPHKPTLSPSPSMLIYPLQYPTHSMAKPSLIDGQGTDPIHKSLILITKQMAVIFTSACECSL